MFVVKFNIYENTEDALPKIEEEDLVNAMIEIEELCGDRDWYVTFNVSSEGGIVARYGFGDEGTLSELTTLATIVEE